VSIAEPLQSDANVQYDLKRMIEELSCSPPDLVVRYSLFPAMLLASSNWVVGLCWSGVLVLYAQRIPRQESMMLETFGDECRRYMKTTDRLLSRIDR
jgi:hypothetical protein